MPFVSFITHKNTPLAITNNATPKNKDAYADKCCNEDDYAECHNAKCRYAKCHGVLKRGSEKGGKEPFVSSTLESSNE